jgi:hypothetical protein
VKLSGFSSVAIWRDARERDQAYITCVQIPYFRLVRLSPLGLAEQHYSK